jgi:hypothetical protein
VQEPVGKYTGETWYGLSSISLYDQIPVGTQLYTTPPAAQREWVDLTDEGVEEVWEQVESSDFLDCVHPFARAIGAKLKEQNEM